MFTLGIHYLTGYATATDTGSRERSEWPPHPARIFMALVAAHYEGKKYHAFDSEIEEERAALEYLAALSPPSMKVSDADRRDTVIHYVPVNDTIPSHKEKNAELRKKLPGVVGIPRSKQPRYIPKIRPHVPYVFVIWPDIVLKSEQRTVLDRLCSKVTRIGHSSSLVQMWVVEPGAEPEPDLFPVPEKGFFPEVNPRRKPEVFHLRVTSSGTLKYLDEQFNSDNIEKFFEFKIQIAGTKGKHKKELSTQFNEYFGVPFTKSLLPPNRGWPTLALTQAYVRKSTAVKNTVETSIYLSPFDSDLIVLTQLEGPVLGLESTALLTKALRGALLKVCSPNGDAPEWLCGHKIDGLPATGPHLAIFPLAFVGHKHADGHLLGLALAIPRDVLPRDRIRFLRPLLFSSDKEGIPRPAEITLTLGMLGIWTLSLEERSQPPSTLRSETWCRSSTTWATVTPMVLDRHPKTKTPAERCHEIHQFISESCERAGLPRPVEIDIDKTAWYSGTPQSAPIKGGFPLLFPHRQQFHVWLRFPFPVRGPILIGSGRYRGYGFFKPYRLNQDE